MAVWGNQVWVNSNYFQAGIQVDQGAIENTRVYYSVYGQVWTRYRYNVYANGSVWDNDGGSKSYDGRLEQNAGVTTTFASYGKWITRTKSARTITFSASYTVTGGYGNGTSSVSTTVTVPALPSYAVSYNANGGSGAPGQQTKWYNETLKLSSTKPTRTGYTFQGWATSSGGSVAYAAGANYTSNAAVTLYAVWKANTWTVSYNANGGTGAPSAQTKTYGVTLKLSSTKPTRTNYDFLGWGTSASATTVAYAAGANYTNNAAITLYAVWKLAYSPPSITNLVTQRCDSAGTADDFGEYFKVSFGWSCDQKIGTNNVSSITIKHKAKDVSTWTTTTISASGTSGSVSKVIGTISIEDAYDVQITVTDSRDSTVVTSVIPSAKFIMDFLAGGNGVSFGKPADAEGFEVAMRASFEGGIWPIYIPANADLNDYKTPGFYYNRLNSQVATMANVPVQEAFSLEVTRHAGFHQRFVIYRTSGWRVYERNFYSTSWGPWRIALFNDIAEHIYMHNNIALCAKTTSGSNVSLLRMNTSNQVELNWTSGGLRGRVMKLLWEGSCTVGASITSQEFPYYNVIVVHAIDPTLMQPILCVRRSGFSGGNSTFFGSAIDDYHTNKDPWVFIVRLESYANNLTVLKNANTFVYNFKAREYYNTTIKRIYGVL